MASGIDTLCGNAHGAGSGATARAVMRRAMVVCLLTSLPCLALWTQAGRLMRALGERAGGALGAVWGARTGRLPGLQVRQVHGTTEVNGHSGALPLGPVTIF